MLQFLFEALRINWDTLSQENKLIYEILDTYAKVQTQFRCCRMRQSRLQQTTFINIFYCFSEKIRLDVSSESKNQALFSSKDKSKKLKCHLLQFLFGALRVNYCHRDYSPTD